MALNMFNLAQMFLDVALREMGMHPSQKAEGFTIKSLMLRAFPLLEGLSLEDARVPKP